MDDWDKFGYTNHNSNRSSGQPDPNTANQETEAGGTSNCTDFIIKENGEENGEQTVYVSSGNKEKKKMMKKLFFFMIMLLTKRTLLGILLIFKIN